MKKRIFAAILAAVMCLVSFTSYAGYWDSMGNYHYTSSGSSSGGGSAGGGTVKFVPKYGVVNGVAGPGATTAATGTTSYADVSGRATIDGTWSKNAEGNWQFLVDGTPVHKGWYLVKNSSVNQNQWYYFEGDIMVTGWKWILGADGLYRCYFFNGDNGNSHGACAINTVTPDNYTVNASGAWTVEGVEVTKKSL